MVKGDATVSCIAAASVIAKVGEGREEPWRGHGGLGRDGAKRRSGRSLVEEPTAYDSGVGSKRTLS